MDRRTFLAVSTQMGIGAAGLALASQVSGASPPRFGDRIITLDTPGPKCFALYKGGKQIGLVYWINLDTRQYRRCALWVDIASKGPWEGDGRIVRHHQYADKSNVSVAYSKVTFRLPHHPDDADGTPHEGPYERTYAIGHYPVVDYPSRFPATSPLTVEGTFDECLLTHSAPPEIRALYPDLRVMGAISYTEPDPAHTHGGSLAGINVKIPVGDRDCKILF